MRKKRLKTTFDKSSKYPPKHLNLLDKVQQAKKLRTYGSFFCANFVYSRKEKALLRFLSTEPSLDWDKEPVPVSLGPSLGWDKKPVPKLIHLLLLYSLLSRLAFVF